MRGIITVSFLAALVAPAAAFGQSLPPGPGADLVAQTCNACHGLGQITSQRHDAAGWRDVVDQMIDNGAIATDAQETQIVNYLAANFGYGPPAASTTTKTPSTTSPATGAAPAPATPEEPN